jgi:hypothetical protein
MTASEIDDEFEFRSFCELVLAYLGILASYVIKGDTLCDCLVPLDPFLHNILQATGFSREFDEKRTLRSILRPQTPCPRLSCKAKTSSHWISHCAVNSPHDRLRVFTYR